MKLNLQEEIIKNWKLLLPMWINMKMKEMEIKDNMHLPKM